MNPVVHAPGVLLNAGRIERSRGEFWFYDEGVTPVSCRSSRRSMQNGSQSESNLASTCYLSLPRSTPPDLAPTAISLSVINGSRMLTALQAPGSLDTRWISEDALRPGYLGGELARTVAVETPVIDALITLSSALTGVEFRQQARTLRALGLAGRSPSEILSTFSSDHRYIARRERFLRDVRSTS